MPVTARHLSWISPPPAPQKSAQRLLKASRPGPPPTRWRGMPSCSAPAPLSGGWGDGLPKGWPALPAAQPPERDPAVILCGVGLGHSSPLPPACSASGRGAKSGSTSPLQLPGKVTPSRATADLTGSGSGCSGHSSPHWQRQRGLSQWLTRPGGAVGWPSGRVGSPTACPHSWDPAHLGDQQLRCLAGVGWGVGRRQRRQPRARREPAGGGPGKAREMSASPPQKKKWWEGL